VDKSRHDSITRHSPAAVNAIVSSVAFTRKSSLNCPSMDDKGGSQSTKGLTQEVRRPIVVAAPKEYFLAPIFAATPQTGARAVTVGDHRYVIGGFFPMECDLPPPPALDVRHARAIFALLSFRSVYDDTCLVRFSFNELCTRYAQSNGGRYARAIKKIVHDLMSAYIRITDIKTNFDREFRLIERIDIEKRPPRRCDSKLALSGQKEMWFNGCELSPEFAGLLSQFKELQDLNLDVFNSITSPLAQSIYLYIPSRAHHHSENDPFEITLTNLLRQVSAAVPKHKSKRREVFMQNKSSIIDQLDGLETLTGIFRVKLAETTDGADWKLQTWVEHRARQSRIGSGNSKVVAAFLKSGRTPEQLEHAFANIRPLSDYDIELLTAAKVEIARNRPFFEQIKAILKEARFVTLLAEAKGDELEGRKARKTPTARLIYRMMEAIAVPPTQPKMGNICLDS